MMDSKDWLMEVLLGHGLKCKEVRQKVGKAVAAFIAVAMRLRKKNVSRWSRLELEARIVCLLGARCLK